MNREAYIEETKRELGDMFCYILAEADAEAIANYLWNNGHRKSNGWVKTTERPPDSNGYYLCYCRTSKVGSQENWEVKKLYWENNVWLLHKNSFTVFDTVSHWAEIPEAPTEGE